MSVAFLLMMNEVVDLMGIGIKLPRGPWKLQQCYASFVRLHEVMFVVVGRLDVFSIDILFLGGCDNKY